MCLKSGVISEFLFFDSSRDLTRPNNSNNNHHHHHV